MTTSLVPSISSSSSSSSMPKSSSATLSSNSSSSSSSTESGVMLPASPTIYEISGQNFAQIENLEDCYV